MQFIRCQLNKTSLCRSRMSCKYAERLKVTAECIFVNYLLIWLIVHAVSIAEVLCWMCARIFFYIFTFRHHHFFPSKKIFNKFHFHSCFFAEGRFQSYADVYIENQINSSPWKLSMLPNLQQAPVWVLRVSNPHQSISSHKHSPLMLELIPNKVAIL